MRRLLFAFLLPVAACSQSPAAPSAAGNSASVLEGQTVSALDGEALSGVSVRVGGSRQATSDASGLFNVELGSAGIFDATLRSAGFVDRETTITAPGNGRARLSLIPSSFDLESFDQMFRATNSRLGRWTSRPHLVVVATVMNYRNTSDDEYVATAEQMTDDEVARMVEHLTDGLAMLTGETFTTFASVEVERPGAGDRVRVARDRRIVVGRYNGIVSFARTVGYGSWASQPDGTVTGGAMFLDRDFDRGDGRRRLLRTHELGHALGYQHVTSRPSVMNPAIGPEPSVQDRAGAIIAFQRPPGNRAPDIDPAASPATFASAGGPSRWTTVVCQ
jgi:hypothetical protein